MVVPIVRCVKGDIPREYERKSEDSFDRESGGSRYINEVERYTI